MADILGDSIIVNKNHIIEDNSLVKNYIIPSSPLITESIMMVLLKALRGFKLFSCVELFSLWCYSTI